jgi:hypothetical protein
MIGSNIFDVGTGFKIHVQNLESICNESSLHLMVDRSVGSERWRMVDFQQKWL